jgi:D-3-phosphoglycerate dehydrogenase
VSTVKKEPAMSRVLITSRIIGTTVKEPVQMLEEAGCIVVPNPHLAAGKNLKEEHLIPLVEGVDAMLVGEDDVTRKVIEHADRLKVISKNGVGVNQIDVAAATEKGVLVTNTPGANSNAVADLTFGLLLAVARRIPFSHNATREGKWDKFIGVELWRKTIGIVGVGHIGKGVARRARGFEMRIVGYDVVEDEAFARETGLTYVPLERLLREADFVTLHVPLVPATEGLVTREHLRMMKETAYLVNIARGGVVRSDDLYDALQHRELAGAALDVFEREPPHGNPLLALDNVVTTSHIGAFTWDSMRQMGTTAAQNILDVLQGRRPAFPVNPEVLARP